MIVSVFFFSFSFRVARFEACRVARLTFPQAYDLDGDGKITLQEMVRYLNSVFTIIAKTSPEVNGRPLHPTSLSQTQLS
jgi:hypothetical protein